MVNALLLIVPGAVLLTLGVLGWRGTLPSWASIRMHPGSLRVDNRAAGPLFAAGGAIGLLGGLLSLTNDTFFIIGSTGMLALFGTGLIRGLYRTWSSR
jgi:hypothetical protein